MNSIADTLKYLRQINRMTQGEVADAISVNRSTYTSYETGRREPSNETLISLAKVFNVSTDYLLGLEKDEIDIDETQLKRLRNIAAHANDISEEEMNEILSFIDFIKQRDSRK